MPFLCPIVWYGDGLRICALECSVKQEHSEQRELYGHMWSTYDFIWSIHRLHDGLAVYVYIHIHINIYIYIYVYILYVCIYSVSLYLSLSLYIYIYIYTPYLSVTSHRLSKVFGRRLGTSWGRLRSLGGPSESLWGSLGRSWDLLGPLGTVLGASWVSYWKLLAVSGRLLGPSWGCLGASWRSFFSFVGNLGGDIAFVVSFREVWHCFGVKFSLIFWIENGFELKEHLNVNLSCVTNSDKSKTQ